ncbi:MAG: 3-dehydroquinate synthase family protein [Phycisphaerales bacterium]
MSGRSVEVELPGRGYGVHVGSGSLGSVAKGIREVCGERAKRAFVVVDTGVPERFADAMIEGLEAHGLSATVSRLTPSEKVKSFETYQRLLVEIASTGHTRVDVVVALGGGVVGDLAGFVAASYQRGVPVVQCPTTLLAMVDASVGGKTGFNLALPAQSGDDEPVLLKNLVGAFHQPKMVVADMEVLDSLDERYRRAGLAECVKHGMICQTIGQGHEGLMDWMLGNLDGIREFEGSVIEELVARNVGLKATVVVGDEHESTAGNIGGRMLLNFGHTFGHAIETIGSLSPEVDRPELGPLHHGEAVALGMVAACACSVKMGRFESAGLAELTGMLDRIGLPTKVGGLPSSDEVIERMQRDKKTAGGVLRVILPVGRGICEIVDGVGHEDLGAGIDFIRA